MSYDTISEVLMEQPECTIRLPELAKLWRVSEEAIWYWAVHGHPFDGHTDGVGWYDYATIDMFAQREHSNFPPVAELLAYEAETGKPSLLTTLEVAHLKHKTAKTIERMALNGELPYTRAPSVQFLFPARALELRPKAPTPPPQVGVKTATPPHTPAKATPAAKASPPPIAEIMLSPEVAAAIPATTHEMVVAAIESGELRGTPVGDGTYRIPGALARVYIRQRLRELDGPEYHLPFGQYVYR